MLSNFLASCAVVHAVSAGSGTDPANNSKPTAPDSPCRSPPPPHHRHHFPNLRLQNKGKTCKQLDVNCGSCQPAPNRHVCKACRGNTWKLSAGKVSNLGACPWRSSP